MKDHRTAIVIVKADDWKGIYFDGKLQEQGHSLDLMMDVLVPLCGLRIGHTEQRWVNDDWLETEGDLPQLLSDIPAGAWE